MGDVDLKGLNAVVVSSPKQMTDGGWKLALYIDERASKAQADALTGIFSGASGGHLANLGPLVGSVAGVTAAPITFEVALGSAGWRSASTFVGRSRSSKAATEKLRR
jgi:hypothetical protein